MQNSSQQASTAAVSALQYGLAARMYPVEQSATENTCSSTSLILWVIRLEYNAPFEANSF
jgi:hypothetical protein